MSGSDQSTTATGREILEAVANIEDVMNGDYDKEAYEEAKELGLTETQKAVAERYAGEGRVEVEDSRIPTLMDKLQAKAKIPWTFVLGHVEFVIKANSGMGKSNGSEWFWQEDGYRFTFYKYDAERTNEVRIEEVDA